MKIEDIKTVAVLGAGDMGHGIAEVALIAGYKVFLRDIKGGFVDKGVSRIYESLEKLVTKGKVSEDYFKKIKNELLVPCVNLEDAVREADLVIEAIPEIMELKKETFEIVDRVAPPHAILASNTSTMSITEIAAITKRPEKFVGLHYFNPAILMKLVEVIRGDKTSNETMQICYDFVLKNKKVPVRVQKDVPGFIVNRVQSPSIVFLNAVLDNKIAEPEEIDAVMRNAGMPMGPFEILDYTGLDVNFHVGEYLSEAIHADFKMGETLKEKYKAGKYGKKTGEGIFKWSGGRAEIDLTKTTDKFDPMDMIIVNANEAAKIVEMGACTFDDVDLGIKNATGNVLGVIALIKSMKPEDLCNKLDGFADQFGKEIFRPAKLIREGAYR